MRYHWGWRGGKEGAFSRCSWILHWEFATWARGGNRKMQRVQYVNLVRLIAEGGEMGGTPAQSSSEEILVFLSKRMHYSPPWGIIQHIKVYEFPALLTSCLIFLLRHRLCCTESNIAAQAYHVKLQTSDRFVLPMPTLAYDVIHVIVVYFGELLLLEKTNNHVTMVLSKPFIVVGFETAAHVIENWTDRELLGARTMTSKPPTLLRSFVTQDPRVGWLEAVELKPRLGCVVKVNDFQVVVAVQNEIRWPNVSVHISKWFKRGNPVGQLCHPPPYQALWFAFDHSDNSIARWIPHLMLPKSLVDGAAAEILQEICGWDPIKAPDQVWTVRHHVKHFVDAVLVMNAFIVIRKRTLHGNVVGDLIDKPNTTKTQQPWFTESYHDRGKPSVLSPFKKRDDIFMWEEAP